MNYYIKQLGDKDCGIACLKMLLANIYKNKDYLYYPQKGLREPITLLEMMNLAKKNGLDISASRVVEKEELFEDGIKNPLLATLVEGKELHTVMIKKLRKRKVLIYDPKRGIYWMKKEEFIAKWNGYILEVIQAHEPTRYHAKELKVVPKTQMFITLVLQLVSTTFALISMYFLDSNWFVLPLILFGIYFIFESIYQQSISTSMKCFDKAMLDFNYLPHRAHFKDYYEDMSKFKIIMITTPIKLVNSVIVIMFGTFILGINDLYYLIILGILFTILGLTKYFESTYGIKNKNEIEVIEKSLFLRTPKDANKFREKVEDLNKKTYKVVDYFRWKKCLILFLTLSLCFGYQCLTGFLSFNFIIFHFFLYVYMEENFSNLLNISEIQKEYRYYKCLYYHYFS